MNLTVNSNYTANTYKPTFKRVDIMKEVKRIPGVPCACCGKEVIMEEAVKKVYSAVTKPLATMIKKGAMDRWKVFPMLWEALNVFAQVNPKESLDKMLKKDEEFVLLKKAIVKDVTGDPNQTTTNKEDKKKIIDIYTSVINDSRSELKTAKTVISKFGIFKTFLEGSRSESFELFEIYSKKHPRKTLKDIVNDPAINKTHGLKNTLQKSIINLKREHYLGEIEDLIVKVSRSAKDELEESKENVTNLLLRERDNNIKLYKIKDIYKKILTKNNCTELEEKVNQTIEKIPLTYSSADLYFVSCVHHNYNDFEIINNIIGPYISSYEHIIPRSANGEDAIGNGLTLHTKCNKHRGKIPYKELLEYHPEMIENTKKQIDYISNALLTGKAHDYLRYWPLKVTKTLNKYTDGKISHDVSEYCQKRLKQLQRKLKGKPPEPNTDESRQISVFTRYLEGKWNES